MLNFSLRFTLLLVLSCEFKSSPYDTKTPKVRRNETNIELIHNNETSVGTNFKVALIADTHNYYDDLESAVRAINRNGPYSFVVVNGDITNFGMIEEFEKTKRILNKLSFPYIVNIGNHDLLSNGKIIFDRMFGETDFSLVYKNVHFIFFNNNNWETSGAVPNRIWVESTLMASASPFRVLVAHVSPLDHKRFSPAVMDEWESLVATYGVNYFLSGHDHSYQEDSFGGATRITIGSPSKRSFVELSITPGGIGHQKISF